MPSLEQKDAEVLFQLLSALAEPRLTDTKHCRRTPEIEMLCDGHCLAELGASCPAPGLFLLDEDFEKDERLLKWLNRARSTLPPGYIN